jgi:hypothetical protein
MHVKPHYPKMLAIAKIPTFPLYAKTKNAARWSGTRKAMK